MAILKTKKKQNLTPAPTPTTASPSSPPPKKKQLPRTPADLAAIQSDVASFASTLGLAPPTASTGGFDDSDFRKPHPKFAKPLKPVDSEPPAANPDLRAKPRPKPHPLQLPPSIPKHEKSSFPKLPLMRAGGLSGQWYADAEELERKVIGEKPPPALAVGGREREGMAAKKKEMAERLMEQYALDYESSRKKNGDVRMLEMTARSGTSADKVSAFTCLVEDNPIANMRSLDALLSMVTSKVGKRYAFTGFEALKALFLLRLLPDCKLKNLLQRPFDNLPETKDGFSLLLFWYWEECLKQRYEKFVIALEESLKDMLPNLKDKAMKTVYDLLTTKSEQERRLLTALVNKLGDPERKVASSAGYHLSRLLSTHPNMKAVVIQEVDSFIFRPHIGLRAKYQAVNFLNQILLSKKGDGPKVAKHLLDVYFAVFKILISDGRDGQNMHKNKFDDNGGGKKEKAKNQEGKSKTAISIDSKRKQSVDSNVEMDSRLLSALLIGVNRAFPFLSSDEADDMLEVQTPVLFKLVHSENFNVGVQALMLLYQISSKNQIASDRFYRALYAKLLSPTALNSSKSEMFLGLLIKAMKNDINSKRVSAFSKRLLQVALQRPPQYACGCLFLMSEVLKANPTLWATVLQNESVDDDLEHFEDIIEDPDPVMPSTSNFVNSGGSVSQNGGKLNLLCKEEYGSVGSHSKDQSQKTKKRPALPAGYDPRHREPSFCNADRSSWWELMVLASHAHPSVATMARTLLSGANIVYNGDPINDLSLNAFLDKFMEKKPKPNKRAEGRWHGGSQIAPARKLDLNHHLVGDAILDLAEDEVPPEDVVFHRFYKNKTSTKKPKSKKKKGQAEDEDVDELAPDADEELVSDGTDESEEEEIDNILGSRPVPLEEEKGDYEYDDLDTLAGEDDDDLLGGDSDAELGSPAKYEGSSDDGGDDDDDVVSISNKGGSSSDDDGSLDILGDDDSLTDDEDDDVCAKSSKTKKGKKRKSRPSPFASIEDYEHLIKEDGESRKKLKPGKKRGKLSN